MKTIPMEVKRAMRSLLGMVHAVAGASQKPGAKTGKTAGPEYRTIDRGREGPYDVYGRKGEVAIYSGREAFEFYKKLTFDKIPPL